MVQDSGDDLESAEALFDRILADGRSEIDRLISNHKSESSILEYKRSSCPSGTKLSRPDFEALRQAIVGFRNAQGGVLVWGVECTPDEFTGADVPTSIEKITDVCRYASWLNSKIGDTSVPPPIGVRNEPIAFDNGQDGCVVTHIPELTNDICFTNEKHGKCYVRSGSSFRPLEPKEVAILQERKRLPRMRFCWLEAASSGRDGGAPRITIKLCFENVGGSAASEYYIDFSRFQKCGYACKFERRHPPNCAWISQPSSGSDFGWEARLSETIYPGRQVHLPQLVSLILKPPIERDLVLRGVYGCEGQQSRAFEKRVSAKSIEKALNLFTLEPAGDRALQDMLNAELLD
ncbi:MAG: ATP-binding protein [Candidatus Zixiibacteriota bacterium]